MNDDKTRHELAPCQPNLGMQQESEPFELGGD